MFVVVFQYFFSANSPTIIKLKKTKEQIKSNNSNHSETNKISKDVNNGIKIQNNEQQQQVNIPVIANNISEVVEVSVPVEVVPVVKGNIVQNC